MDLPLIDTNEGKVNNISLIPSNAQKTRKKNFKENVKLTRLEIKPTFYLKKYF